MVNRIEVRPDIHFGKPCVSGTRVPVQAVLELIENGLSFSGIIKDYYPDLKAEDIQACVHYAVALVGSKDIHTVAANG